MKVLFRLPLWQTAGVVASLLEMANLNWAVPDYTTLCRRQKTLAVQIPYRRADGPFNLLVPSRDHAAREPAGQRLMHGTQLRPPGCGGQARIAVLNSCTALGRYITKVIS